VTPPSGRASPFKKPVVSLNTPVTVVAYTRVSTQEQAQSGLGLEAQRQAIAALCERRGWRLVCSFEDAGKSGRAIAKRPGLQAALGAIESKQATTLVVASLSRLSRSVLDFATLSERSRREGWGLVVCDLVDTTTPQGEALASVIATFAQLERRLIGQRTRDALAVRKQQGVRLGRPRSVAPADAGRAQRLRARGLTLCAIAARLTGLGLGEKRVNYKIRDWLVSRQRYWGCPIPIVYDPEGTPHVVPSEHLPWLLPTDVDFKPTGKSPLATSKELHERVERIFGEGWTPEYDTLDVFVDSAWYYMRYLDPRDSHDFSDQTLMKRWMPINRYAGGAEHTTVHLLYSRFFYKALYDLALVPTPEPYYERFNRGIILGPDGQKMSKRSGNVVNPDDMVARYGADAIRVYLAFIGPYNEPGSYPWNLDGVESMRRFLDRTVSVSKKVADVEPNDEICPLYPSDAADEFRV